MVKQTKQNPVDMLIGKQKKLNAIKTSGTIMSGDGWSLDTTVNFNGTKDSSYYENTVNIHYNIKTKKGKNLTMFALLYFAPTKHDSYVENSYRIFGTLHAFNKCVKTPDYIDGWIHNLTLARMNKMGEGLFYDISIKNPAQLAAISFLSDEVKNWLMIASQQQISKDQLRKYVNSFLAVE